MMLVVTKKFFRHCSVILLAGVALAKVHTAGAMFFSLLLSIAAYAWPFGSWYAVGLVILLLVHEVGHVIAARSVGIKVSWLIFVPFLGAVVRLGRSPVNVKMAANIAIGGPALGTISALICIAAYLWTDTVLLLVLAYTACVFNLFNLIPCEPLDGSIIGEAISPHLWIAGSCMIGMAFFYTCNVLVLLIFMFSLRRLWSGPNQQEQAYYRLSLRQRLQVLFWYLGLVVVLAAAALYSGKLLQ